MGFGTPPTPAVVLEGDYSDWTIYDRFDDTEMYSGWHWDNAALFNREETEAILIDANVCKKYIIATKTLGSSLFTPDWVTGTSHGVAFTRSAYGTYIVWMEFVAGNVVSIKIIKDGDVVKTMTRSDLALTKIYGAFFSPKGKYIAVAGQHSATGNDGWVILEGS